MLGGCGRPGMLSDLVASSLRRFVALVYPYAGGVGVAMGVDVEAGECVDDDLFEEAHVAVDAEAEAVEVEDGIGDELARAVVGDVAAAVGFGDGDAGGEELGGCGGEMLPGVLAAADGDDGRVVFEEEEVADG